jgi:hypothetical protein
MSFILVGFCSQIVVNNACGACLIFYFVLNLKIVEVFYTLRRF